MASSPVCRVDQDDLHALRRLITRVAAGRPRGDHEPGPDRQRRLRAREGRRRVVVEADPDEREPLRREAGEPVVAPAVGRAGLARHRIAQAERADRRAGAVVDDPLEQRGDQVGGLRRDHRLALRQRLTFERPAVRPAHAFDQVDRRPDAAVGERRVDARQLERRHLEGAERHRGEGAEPRRDPEAPRLVHDVVEPGLQGEPRGRHVETLLERGARGDPAAVLVVVVLGRPVLAPRFDRERRVLEQRRRGRDPLLERGRVDDRFERAAGLALRLPGAVELALAIVAAADVGAHRAARRLDGDERRLEGLLLPAHPLAAADQVGDPRRDRRLGRSLLGRIERAVDRQAGVGELADSPTPLDLVRGGVGVVGRHAARERDLARVERPRLGGVGLRARDPAQLDQAIEHPVAPFAGELGVPVRREVGGRGNHARQQRAVGEVELARRLAEPGPGRGAEADQVGRAAPPPEDLVQVGLEDLLLGVARLEHHREQRLAQLAADAPLVGEIEVLGQLLGDRRSALPHLAGPQVGPESTQHADERDAGVLEEGGILGSEHRAHRVGRKLGEPHRAALEQVASVEGREQRRIEGRLRHRLLADQQARDPLAVELDDQQPAPLLAALRAEAPPGDRHPFGAGAVGPGHQPGLPRRPVEELVEARGELFRRHRESGREAQGAAVEAGGLDRRHRLEAPGELPVGPDAPGGGAEQHDAQGDEDLQQPAVAPPQEAGQRAAERLLLRHHGTPVRPLTGAS